MVDESNDLVVKTPDSKFKIEPANCRSQRLATIMTLCERTEKIHCFLETGIPDKSGGESAGSGVMQMNKMTLPSRGFEFRALAVRRRARYF